MTISQRRRITRYSLRRFIDERLRNLGFARTPHGYRIPGELSKQRVRDFHASNREYLLRNERAFIESHGWLLLQNFVAGRQLDPELINPELVEVMSGTTESHLFRFATLLWSVPVSRGFGRRIRFLIRDRQNGKLIGLFALGDPVFNLTARDQWIGWTHADREERLVHMMDAYVVGAVPPYSQLIGGKLVAALMGSVEVQEAYKRRYLHRVSVITGKAKRARLVLLTTTSALGRSSLYNRLAIPEGPNWKRIGTTRGFGHFHLSGETFDLMRKYLEQQNHPYASGNRFGNGPNWRLRVARAALEDIGFDGDHVLRHGIEREVYAVPLATNWREVLLGQHKRVHGRVLPAVEIANYCLRRWIIPRSHRDDRFREFVPHSIMRHLLNGGPPAAW